MYANLKVRVTDQATGLKTEHYCWRVTVASDIAVLHIDAQDGQGSYAEPAGELEVDTRTQDLEVVTDF
jgi:hypothetical protein